MKIEVEITKEEVEFLKQLKNYFGEHDKTMFEHKAYAMLDRLVKKLNIQPVIKSVCFGCKRALTVRNEDDVKCLECINGDEKQTVL